MKNPGRRQPTGDILSQLNGYCLLTVQIYVFLSYHKTIITMYSLITISSIALLAAFIVVNGIIESKKSNSEKSIK